MPDVRCHLVSNVSVVHLHLVCVVHLHFVCVVHLHPVRIVYHRLVIATRNMVAHLLRVSIVPLVIRANKLHAPITGAVRPPHPLFSVAPLATTHRPTPAISNLPHHLHRAPIEHFRAVQLAFLLPSRVEPRVSTKTTALRDRGPVATVHPPLMQPTRPRSLPQPLDEFELPLLLLLRVAINLRNVFVHALLSGGVRLEWSHNAPDRGGHCTLARLLVALNSVMRVVLRFDALVRRRRSSPRFVLRSRDREPPRARCHPPLRCLAREHVDHAHDPSHDAPDPVLHARANDPVAVHVRLLQWPARCPFRRMHHR
mmetsp:Transcript_3720/g.9014  ORF Transcript_3720/g.9014 Transcript_3720/m.9014 type:complete len:312 (+) Transcript_3720:71-1006(+)